MTQAPPVIEIFHRYFVEADVGIPDRMFAQECAGGLAYPVKPDAVEFLGLSATHDQDPLGVDSG